MDETRPRDVHVRRDGDAYAQGFLTLLPQGQAWPKHAWGSTLVRVVYGLCNYWGFVDGRAADLLERESDPRKTIELLPDWERNWGLPDPCWTVPQTIEERQQQLVWKMTWLGRQDRQFFIDIAAELGYTITITEYAPWMFGVSECGPTDDGHDYWRWEIGPPEMRFTWKVHISGAHLAWWRFGSAQFGIDPHVRIGIAHDIECLFNRWKPAQTNVIFDYSDSGGAIDTTPPVISAVVSSALGLASATITWTTDEPATSRVEYGPTTAYGSLTTLDTALVTSHSVTLTGLSPGTLYNFRVRSQDVVPNEAIGTNNTLTTTSPAWARVQGIVNTTGGTTSGTLTLPAAVTNGNIIVGAILTLQSQVTGITDDKGNQYLIVNQDGLGKNYLIPTGFCSAAPITNGPQTLTITYGSSSVFWGVAEEFSAGSTTPSGIAIDGTQVLIDSTAVAMPGFQTLHNSDLLWSTAFNTGATNAGASWTVGSGNGTQQLSMWKQATSGGTVIADYASNGGNVWSTAFGITAQPRSSWRLRQNQIQRTNSGGTSGGITFVNPVANGSFVVGTIAMNNAAGTGTGDISDIISITDDKGNVYSKSTASISGRVMFWSGILTNAPQTITVTTSVAEGLIYLLANEFVPPPGTTAIAVDGTPTMTSPPTSPFSSATVTTTQNGDLIYSEADMTGGNALPANGFSTLNGQGMTWADGYLIQGGAGPVNAIWTGGSGGSISMGLVAFKAT